MLALQLSFLDTAGVRRQLLELKKELKCWEAMFERKHGRKPNKVSGMMAHSQCKTYLHFISRTMLNRVHLK